MPDNASTLPPLKEEIILWPEQFLLLQEQCYKSIALAQLQASEWSRFPNGPAEGKYIHFVVPCVGKITDFFLLWGDL